MIKRVFWVALFTGLSHLISIITISYVLRVLGEEVSGYLGVIDSTIVLVASIISFGIQLAVNRNVATRSSWQSNYKLGQSSRLMLSFFVLIFGLIIFFIEGDFTMLIYCFAPLIALNGDYALYGNGKPIIAASLSFLRVALPNLGIIFTGYFLGVDVIPTYIFLLSLGIFLAGVISAHYNGVSYFYLPRKKFAKFYYKYLKVGVYQVASVLLIAGILVIANWFYTIVVIGLINGLLKLLIVYKGGLRIIVQTFFKEIRLKGTSQKIDKASILAWGLISIPVIIFYDTTIQLLFGDMYNNYVLLLPMVGIIMLIASFRNSAEARALIIRNDNLNLYLFLTALIVEVIFIVAYSYLDDPIWGIPIGILLGELILVIGYSLYIRKFFVDRFMFLVKLSPVLIIAFLMRLSLGSYTYSLIASIAIYILWVIIFYRRLIFGSLTNNIAKGN
jgi:O-antigen/teichoic acid export membrane protein